LHSGISFVTPEQKYLGQDIAILEGRKEVYKKAKEKNPRRCSHNKIKSFEETLEVRVSYKTKRTFGKFAKAS